MITFSILYMNKNGHKRINETKPNTSQDKKLNLGNSSIWVIVFHIRNFSHYNIHSPLAIKSNYVLKYKIWLFATKWIYIQSWMK